MAQIGNNGTGKTDWYGSLGTLLREIFPVGEIASGLAVQAQSSPNMSIKVTYGTAFIPTGSGANKQSLLARLDTLAGADVTITTANATNPRNDLIVGYYDLAVIDTSNVNNPGAFKFIAVSGAPASTPADPSPTTIQAAVGGSNPYVILGRVRVNAGATAITNTNVTDLRKFAAGTPEKRSGGAKVGVIPGSTFATTGNKAITGLGFKPKLVRFTGVGSDNAATSSKSFGAMDSSGNQFMVLEYVTNAPAAGRRSATNYCVGYMSTTSGYGLAAGFVSMDEDGFTLNCVLAGTAYDFYYEAYA